MNFIAQLWETGLCIPLLPILSCKAAFKSYLIHRVCLTTLNYVCDGIQHSTVLYKNY